MQIIKAYLLITISLLSFNIASYCQPGTIDLSFGYPVPSLSLYEFNYQVGNYHSDILDFAIQPDQRIIFCGPYSVGRINPDGTSDSTGFSTDLVNNFTVLKFRALALLPDGKILIVGDVTQNSSSFTHHPIFRINNDGTIDTTFHMGVSGMNSGEGTAVTVQPDGKILVGGEFESYDGESCKGLMRLNSDGTIDSTFQVGNGINGDEVRTIYFDQSNNRIFVGGDFLTYNNQWIYNIICLKYDGTRDTAFHSGTGFNGAVNKILKDTSGNIIVAGEFIIYNGRPAKCFVKLNLSGAIDTTFSYGNEFNDIVHDFTFDASGRIIVVGEFTSYRGNTQKRICRLLNDGTFDNTFWSNASYDVTNFRNVKTVGVEVNGNILCAGGFGEYGSSVRNHIMRFKPDGYLDNSLQPLSGFTQSSPGNSPLEVRDIAIQPDGKIIFAGNFDRYAGTKCNGLVRLDQTGNIDTSFNCGNGAVGIVKIALDTINQKIYVAGDFIYFNNIPLNNFVRLNWNGSIDSTFDMSTGFNAPTNDVLLQPDGKIVIIGGFTSYNNITDSGIVRLNSDGSIDSTFNSGSGFHYTGAATMVLQADGKIIAAGDFDSYDGHASKRIVRINPDGSYDNTFVVNSSFDGYVMKIALDPYGRILVGGLFLFYQNHYVEKMARLLTDGSFDNTFAHGIFSPYSIRDIALQRDEKIIVVGGFFASIARLNENGDVDSTFNVGYGFYGGPNTIAIQNDDNLLIGGMVSEGTTNPTDIESYNEYETCGLVRIFSNSSPTVVNNILEREDFTIFPNPAEYEINVITNGNSGTTLHVEISDILGRIYESKRVNSFIKNNFTMNVQDLNAGFYFLRIIDGNKSMVRQFVVRR